LFFAHVNEKSLICTERALLCIEVNDVIKQTSYTAVNYIVYWSQSIIAICTWRRRMRHIVRGSMQKLYSESGQVTCQNLRSSQLLAAAVWIASLAGAVVQNLNKR